MILIFLQCRSQAGPSPLSRFVQNFDYGRFRFVRDFTYPLSSARLFGNMATPMSGKSSCANVRDSLLPSNAERRSTQSSRHSLSRIMIMAHSGFVRDVAFPLSSAHLSRKSFTFMSGNFIAVISWILTILMSGNMTALISGTLICRPMQSANQPEALVLTLSGILTMTHSSPVLSRILIFRPIQSADRPKVLVPTLSGILILPIRCQLRLCPGL